MGKVVTQATMSLDGFIADPSGGVGPLFDWYGNGDVEVTGADPERVFRVSAASAAYLNEAWADAGVGVIGRRLFIAQARELAGDKYVSVNPGSIAGQAFAAGLVDEVRVDLAPVVLGAGVRYFGDYAGSPLLLENPEVVQGDRVTHLHYRVRRA
jgi:RibD C-terminal domain